MADPFNVARGRKGGNRTAATRDMRAVAANARAGLRRRFEREVDPDGTLDPAERARRTDHAIRAYYAELSLVRLRRQRARRAATGPAEVQE